MLRGTHRNLTVGPEQPNRALVGWERAMKQIEGTATVVHEFWDDGDGILTVERQ